MSTLLDRLADANARLMARDKKRSLDKRETLKMGYRSAAAGFGGALPGFMRGMFGDVNTGELKAPRLDVELDGLAGAALLIAGATGFLDEASEYAAIAGGATVGAVLGRELEQSLLQSRRTAAR